MINLEFSLHAEVSAKHQSLFSGRLIGPRAISTVTNTCLLSSYEHTSSDLWSSSCLTHAIAALTHVSDILPKNSHKTRVNSTLKYFIRQITYLEGKIMRNIVKSKHIWKTI